MANRPSHLRTSALKILHMHSMWLILKDLILLYHWGSIFCDSAWQSLAPSLSLAKTLIFAQGIPTRWWTRFLTSKMGYLDVKQYGADAVPCLHATPALYVRRSSARVTFRNVSLRFSSTLNVCRRSSSKQSRTLACSIACSTQTKSMRSRSALITLVISLLPWTCHDISFFTCIDRCTCVYLYVMCNSATITSLRR